MNRNKTLRNILKRANKRKTIRNKNGKEITWYKKSRDGKCPDQDTNNIFNSYWYHFGCFPHTNRIDRERNGKDAMQCAAERLADAKNVLTRRNKPLNTGHAFPIKLAYDLGKLCLKDTDFYTYYVEKFKQYYKELIQGHPEVHDLFQKEYGVSDYPLDNAFEEIQNGIEWKLKQNKSYTPPSKPTTVITPQTTQINNHKTNPILFTNKNNTNMNMITNHNIAKKNKISHI